MDWCRPKSASREQPVHQLYLAGTGLVLGGGWQGGKHSWSGVGGPVGSLAQGGGWDWDAIIRTGTGIQFACTDLRSAVGRQEPPFVQGHKCCLLSGSGYSAGPLSACSSTAYDCALNLQLLQQWPRSQLGKNLP